MSRCFFLLLLFAVALAQEKITMRSDLEKMTVDELVARWPFVLAQVLPRGCPWFVLFSVGTYVGIVLCSLVRCMQSH